MRLTHWFKRKVSAATRALTLLMPLPQGSAVVLDYIPELTKIGKLK
ncbi:MAG: hypothetical protein OEZ51_07135 [Nitrospinota bacterium]|nr:hypothetical protein [Nitrospinota bacterium]